MRGLAYVTRASNKRGVWWWWLRRRERVGLRGCERLGALNMVVKCLYRYISSIPILSSKQNSYLACMYAFQTFLATGFLLSDLLLMSSAQSLGDTRCPGGFLALSPVLADLACICWEFRPTAMA